MFLCSPPVSSFTLSGLVMESNPAFPVVRFPSGHVNKRRGRGPRRPIAAKTQFPVLRFDSSSKRAARMANIRRPIPTIKFDLFITGNEGRRFSA